jgi:hypothetical protein
LHLGDGVVGAEIECYSGGKTLLVLSSPDNGEFANETHFVTSENAVNSIRLYRGYLTTPWRSFAGFILMSDGPESALFHKSSGNLAAACSKLLSACRELPAEEMQRQLTATLKHVISMKTGDDCSIAMLAR